MPSKHATASGSDILPAEPMEEAASLTCPRPPAHIRSLFNDATIWIL